MNKHNLLFTRHATNEYGGGVKIVIVSEGQETDLD